MNFVVSEREREPVEFDQQLVPGAVDFGEEAEVADGYEAVGM